MKRTLQVAGSSASSEGHGVTGVGATMQDPTQASFQEMNGYRGAFLSSYGRN